MKRDGGVGVGVEVWGGGLCPISNFGRFCFSYCMSVITNPRAVGGERIPTLET